MTDILHLRSLRAVGEPQESQHDYLIRAEVKNPLAACPYCKSQNIKKHGFHDGQYMDTPMHAHRVGILLRHQRYYCKACKKTFSDPLPDINEQHEMTNRLVTFVREQALKRTFVGIADDIGVTEGTVRLIFNEYAKELEKQYILEVPRWMGIDEAHLCGKYRCVLTNIDERKLLEILSNRNQTTVERFLKTIPGRSRIELVTMDMWKYYRRAVQAVLPDAKIVVDKFHIQKMANQALEATRKKARENLETGQKRKLMHERFILLKRERDLDMTQFIFRESWFNELPILEQAYLYKEAFFDIWELTDRKEAEEQYDRWKTNMPESIRPKFNPIFTAMKNWHTEIFNYFDNHRVTNAYTETINGVIKLDNKIGRGYDFETIRVRMLFGGGRVVYRPSFGSDFVFNIASAGKLDEEYHIRDYLFSPGVSISTLIERLEHGDLKDLATTDYE